MSRKTSHPRRASPRLSQRPAARFIPRPLRQSVRAGGFRTVGSLTNTVLGDTMPLRMGQLIPNRRLKHANLFNDNPRRVQSSGLGSLSFPVVSVSDVRSKQELTRALDCARRHERREVLWSTGHAGSSGHRYPGRASPSKLKCK